MVLISLLAVAIYFFATSRLNLSGSDYKNSRSFGIGDYVLYTTAILTNQGTLIYYLAYCSDFQTFLFFYLKKNKKGSVFWQPNQQSRISFRLTAGVWCLFALVMVNVYSGTLTAHITARKMSVPPENSTEVMEQEILPYLVVTDGLGRDLILV
jgi:hypothetical protein